LPEGWVCKSGHCVVVVVPEGLEVEFVVPKSRDFKFEIDMYYLQITEIELYDSVNETVCVYNHG
jgi:hypothetical protein